jgi:hypothetical protein
MMEQRSERARSGLSVEFWLLAATILGSAGSATLILTDNPAAGGVLAAVSGAASVLSGVRARRSGEPRLVFADHAAERVMEAMLFGAIAWAAVPEAPWTSGASLAALVASYLASYLPAKATGLGFRVTERLPWRSVRLSLVALGLLVSDLLAVALWAAAALSLEPVVRHGLAVARQREVG